MGEMFDRGLMSYCQTLDEIMNLEVLEISNVEED